MLEKNVDFWVKFEFLIENSIFDQNFGSVDFCIFGPMIGFSIWIFDQIFIPKKFDWWFLWKISIFNQHFHFVGKISISEKFRRSAKFLPSAVTQIQAKNYNYTLPITGVKNRLQPKNGWFFNKNFDFWPKFGFWTEIFIFWPVLDL